MKWKWVIGVTLLALVGAAYGVDNRNDSRWNQILELQRLREASLVQGTVSRKSLSGSSSPGSSWPHIRAAMEQVEAWRAKRTRRGEESNVYAALRQAPTADHHDDFLDLWAALEELNAAAAKDEAFVDRVEPRRFMDFDPLDPGAGVSLVQAGMFRATEFVRAKQSQAAAQLIFSLLSFSRDLAQLSLIGRDAGLGVALSKLVIVSAMDSQIVSSLSMDTLGEFEGVLLILEEELSSKGEWLDWELYRSARNIIETPGTRSILKVLEEDDHGSIFTLIDDFGIKRVALGGFQERGVWSTSIESSQRIATLYESSFGKPWPIAQKSLRQINSLAAMEDPWFGLSTLVSVAAVQRRELLALIRIARMGLAATLHQDYPSLDDPFGHSLQSNRVGDELSIWSVGPTENGRPQLKFVMRN